MKLLAIFACILAVVSAYEFHHMNPGSRCVWGGTAGGGMSCNSLAHTSYDHAFNLISATPGCKQDPLAQSKTSPSYCYNDQLCMFCFAHNDETYLLEEALGPGMIRECKSEGNHCPSASDVHSWKEAGILHKVHNFWGSRAVPLPQEFSS